MKVVRSDPSGPKPNPSAPIPIVGTTYTDATVAANTMYWYALEASDGTLSSYFGDYSVVTTPLDGPAAPTFANVLSTSLDVNWTAVTGATVGYWVEQADDIFGVAGGFAPVSGTVAGTTFNVTGLTAATPYWFRVIAENATGPSTGAPATVTTAP